MFLCRHLHLDRSEEEKKERNELKWCSDIFLIPVLFPVQESKMGKSKNIPQQSVHSGRKALILRRHSERKK